MDTCKHFGKVIWGLNGLSNRVLCYLHLAYIFDQSGSEIKELWIIGYRNGVFCEKICGCWTIAGVKLNARLVPYKKSPMDFLLCLLLLRDMLMGAFHFCIVIIYNWLTNCILNTCERIAMSVLYFGNSVTCFRSICFSPLYLFVCFTTDGLTPGMGRQAHKANTGY